jgi:hypothetical protein
MINMLEPVMRWPEPQAAGGVMQTIAILRQNVQNYLEALQLCG